MFRLPNSLPRRNRQRFKWQLSPQFATAWFHFNGCCRSKIDKDQHAGVALCARETFLGHVDAMRELDHCLQDGYGMRQSIMEGRRFLVQANARELAAALRSAHSLKPNHHPLGAVTGGCPLLNDFGCNAPAPETHPVNRFLGEWFSSGRASARGPRLCSQVGCGRPETRKHEFRRYSVCEAMNYCSRWRFLLGGEVGRPNVERDGREW